MAVVLWYPRESNCHCTWRPSRTRNYCTRKCGSLELTIICLSKDWEMFSMPSQWTWKSSRSSSHVTTLPPNAWHTLEHGFLRSSSHWWILVWDHRCILYISWSGDCTFYMSKSHHFPKWINFSPLKVFQIPCKVTMVLHLQTIMVTCKKMKSTTRKSHPFGHKWTPRQRILWSR